MKSDFSRGKCPICGLPARFRQNKNGILYTYCDHGHHAKLGRLDSSEATEAINAGRPWNNGVIYLYPLEQKGMNNGTTNTTGTNKSVNYGADPGRRTDGQPTATIRPAVQPVGRDDSDDNDAGGLGFF